MSEHLDFQTDFLDKKTSFKKGLPSENKSNTPDEKDGVQKYNWKKIMLIGGVIVFFGCVIFLDSNSSKSMINMGSYAPSITNQVINVSAGDDSVEYGEYRCFRHHYDKAVALSPEESEQTLKNAQLSMDIRANELERLRREIEYSYITEYSPQWEIDDYNDKVNAYNSKLASYQRDAATLNARIDRFNSQIEAHNQYLIQNCTPR
jgi:hypothetical protein